jgi:uncharacterized protein (DUF58 family)
VKSLLDPPFVRELEVLTRRMRLLAQSRHSGTHRGRRRGSSVEFEDHKRYAASDDARRIDWQVYARTGQVLSRQYRSEEDALMRIIVDHSSSAGVGSPSKLNYARRLAAALSYLNLRSGGRLELFTAPGPGTGGLEAHEPSRSKQALPELLLALERLTATGTTDISAWLDTLQRRVRRPGHLILISDFLDPQDIQPRLEQAHYQGHSLCLFQILAPEDLEPRLAGEMTLVDIENNEELELTVDEKLKQAYSRRLQGLCDRLRQWAQNCGHSYYLCTPQLALRHPVRYFVERHSG